MHSRSNYHIVHIVSFCNNIGCGQPGSSHHGGARAAHISLVYFNVIERWALETSGLMSLRTGTLGGKIVNSKTAAEGYAAPRKTKIGKRPFP